MSGANYIAADRRYLVAVDCPNCAQVELVPIGLVARLDQTKAGAHLGLKVKADTVDHVCGQVTIDDPPDPGDQVPMPLYGADDVE